MVVVLWKVGVIMGLKRIKTLDVSIYTGFVDMSVSM